jgi:hypothetical protein
LNASYSDNPYLNLAVIKLQDLLDDQQENPDTDFLDIITHRDQVLARYQPIFKPGHIPNLTRDEFESFLHYENNHHWSNLHRVKGYITRDMPLLRRAMNILLEEGRPVRERLNKLRPYYRDAAGSFVSHLGIPVLTAILMVAHPDKYGVWNNTSEEGLDIVGLWDQRWNKDPSGDVYDEMNRLFTELAQYLKTDLWTLDVLWWVLKK